MDVLRRENIPITQSLARDKMMGQLQIAENLRIPFTIILGQKEAMENSVIVRDMSTHSQETIRISDLGRYLRKIA
jgi:histidyl-tRNA synthetase